MKKMTCFLLISAFLSAVSGQHLNNISNTSAALLQFHTQPYFPALCTYIAEYDIDNITALNTMAVTKEIPDDRITYKDGFFYESIPGSVKEYIYGKSYKEDCTIPYDDLSYVMVQYYDFEGVIETGEIICNKTIAQDLVEIFYELYLYQYPIESIHLVDDYNADDDLSMLADNTSCFNYRTVAGKNSLSMHAKGLAIDINPFYNPYVSGKGNTIHISPSESEPYADRTKDFPYKISENDLCYKLFIAHGFTWGGHWKSCKDYQHFQKKN